MFIREQVEALGKNLLSAEIMKIVQRWFHDYHEILCYPDLPQDEAKYRQ